MSLMWHSSSHGVIRSNCFPPHWISTIVCSRSPCNWDDSAPRGFSPIRIPSPWVQMGMWSRPLGRVPGMGAECGNRFDHLDRDPTTPEKFLVERGVVGTISFIGGRNISVPASGNVFFSHSGIWTARGGDRQRGSGSHRGAVSSSFRQGHSTFQTVNVMIISDYVMVSAAHLPSFRCVD